MADFSAYLNTPIDNIEAPKPLPTGHYFATIKTPGWASKEAKNEKKTPMVEVGFDIQSADEDVEVDLLPENGVAGKSMFNNYTLNNERGMFQLRQLIEAVIGDSSKGLSLADGLAQIGGQPVKLYIDQEEDSREPGTFQNRIKKTLPAG